MGNILQIFWDEILVVLFWWLTNDTPKGTGDFTVVCSENAKTLN